MFGFTVRKRVAIIYQDQFHGVFPLELSSRVGAGHGM